MDDWGVNSAVSACHMLSNLAKHSQACTVVHLMHSSDCHCTDDLRSMVSLSVCVGLWLRVLGPS